MGICSAVDCHNRSEKKVRCFRFPSDPFRSKQWLINCRRGGNWKPTSNSRICEKHFEESQFENHREDGRKKLKPNAIPTIFNVSSPRPKNHMHERKTLYKPNSTCDMSTSHSQQIKTEDDVSDGVNSNVILCSITGKYISVEENTVISSLPSNFPIKDSYMFQEIEPLHSKMNILNEENQKLLSKNIGLLKVKENIDTRLKNVRYALRITAVDDCPAEEKKGEIVEVVIKPYNLQHYVFMTVQVLEDFRLGKVSMRFNRCLPDDYSCEYFQSWNFDNICKIAFMKNQMWSPIVEKIKPKLSCPNIKKGLYKTANATIDVNKALQFYPDGAKYKWDFNFTAFDNRKKSVYCLHLAGHLIQFTNKHEST